MAMSQHEITVDAVLDQCMDRIIRGEEWQSIVHRYPTLAEDLRPLASLTEDLSRELSMELMGIPAPNGARTRIWQRVEFRRRLGPLSLPARALRRINGQLRVWNREAPTLIGMLVTSAMSSAGLLTALAAGVRTLP